MLKGVIYPKGSRLKVECRIYESQREMLRDARKRPHSFSIANDTQALCDTDFIPKGHLARVFFCRTHISRGVIAHEMLHAAFGLLARRRVKSIDCTTKAASKDEEDLCYVMDSLVDRFYKKFGI